MLKEAVLSEAFALGDGPTNFRVDEVIEFTSFAVVRGKHRLGRGECVRKFREISTGHRAISRKIWNM